MHSKELLHLVQFLFQVSLNLTEKCSRLLSHLHQNVTTVTIRVNEIVLHQHLEKGTSSQTSNHRVQRMTVALKMSHRHALHETLDQNSITSVFLKSTRETDPLITVEMIVESLKIVLLNVEVYLVHQCLLQRTLTHRNLIGLRKQGQKLTYSEQYVHITLDVFIHLRMAHFHCHLMTLEHTLVHLTH